MDICRWLVCAKGVQRRRAVEPHVPVFLQALKASSTGIVAGACSSPSHTAAGFTGSSWALETHRAYERQALALLENRQPQTNFSTKQDCSRCSFTFSEKQSATGVGHTMRGSLPFPTLREGRCRIALLGLNYRLSTEKNPAVLSNARSDRTYAGLVLFLTRSCFQLLISLGRMSHTLAKFYVLHAKLGVTSQPSAIITPMTAPQDFQLIWVCHEPLATALNLHLYECGPSGE